MGRAKGMAAAQLCHKMPQGTHCGLRMRLTQALLINSVPPPSAATVIECSSPHTQTHVHSNGLRLPGKPRFRYVSSFLMNKDVTDNHPSASAPPCSMVRGRDACTQSGAINKLQQAQRKPGLKSNYVPENTSGSI